MALQSCLYRWLQRIFPGKVQLEHFIEDVRLPRPVDCWVGADDDSGRSSIAYWIYPRQLKSVEQRAHIFEALGDFARHVHLVFAGDLLVPAKRDYGHSDGAGETEGEENLPEFVFSTTLRDGIAKSLFDAPPDGCRSPGSLHFLDPLNGGGLTSLRGLHRVHHPQIYAGRRLDSKLDEVDAAENGEFTHPGELDLLNKWRSEAEERKKIREAEQAAATARAEARVAARKARDEQRKKRQPTGGQQRQLRKYTLRERETIQIREPRQKKEKKKKRTSDRSSDSGARDFGYDNASEAGLPAFMIRKYVCRECGAHVTVADALEMHTGDGTCLCKRCGSA